MSSTAPRPDLAVCIGRFQLLHTGHVAMIRHALALAQRCLVVIGSARQARSPRNAFTADEREAMIRLALTPDELARIVFAQVRDWYDTKRWTAAVRAEAAKLTRATDRVVLVGHRKDATSDYLSDFHGWLFHDSGYQGDIHAKSLRAALFASDQLEAGFAAIAGQVPPSTLAFLRAWTQLPVYATLREEWRALEADRAKWAGSPYAPVFVTVDAVVRIADHVLLIRRGRAPGRGLLALPGGFIEPRETAYQSAVRELKEETGLSFYATDLVAALAATRVFDHPDRSQRGRVITHAHYFAFGAGTLPEVRGADDAAEARWVPIAELAALEDQFHDDHFHILDSFLGLLPAG